MAAFKAASPLSPFFQNCSLRLAPSRGYLDCGGGGDCCFNAVAVGLVLCGRLLSAESDPTASIQRHAGWYGEIVRAAVVAHGHLPSTQMAVLADSMSTEPVLFAEAIVSSMASWSDLPRILASLNHDEVSIEGWLRMMSIRSSDSELGTYGDSAAILLLADIYRVRIVCHLLRPTGDSLPGSPQIFDPRASIAPEFEIVLACQPEVHFVLEVGISQLTDPPAPPTTALSQAYLECCAKVRKLGEKFRAEQEGLRTKRVALEAAAAAAASPVLLPQPETAECSACGDTGLVKGEACYVCEIARLGRLSVGDSDMSEAVAASLADADATAVRLATEASLLLGLATEPIETQDMEVCTDSCPPAEEAPSDPREAAALSVALHLSLLGRRADEQAEQADSEERTQIAIEALSEVSRPEPNARRYQLPSAEAPRYRSACSIIFGFSSRLGRAVIMLIQPTRPAGHLSTISEGLEITDSDERETALRGVAEELLGLPEHSAAALQETSRLAARLDEGGFLMEHLGANPSSPHRCFALPADLLFGAHGGIDAACRAFRPNREVAQVTLLPLEAITGQPGEISLRDVRGVVWPLRGNRHLGQKRIDFIKRYLKRRHCLPPAPPPAPPAPPPSAPPRGPPSSGGPRPSGGGPDAAPAAADDTLMPPTLGEHSGAGGRDWSTEQRLLGSFIWPLTSLQDVRRLLSLEAIAPSDLVGFEFSGAVRSALEASGRRALSVDYRACDVGGMHAILDVREVLALQRWSRVFLFPPCYQQLRADADCLDAKIEDGRAFWGCLLVLFCFCVDADVLVVEQPDTIVADYVPMDYTTFRTSSFGDEPDKFVRLLLRNCSLTPPFRPDPSARRRPPHYLTFANSDERDRSKSSWAPFTNLSRAVARLLPAAVPAPSPPCYLDAVERFAAAWHAAGHPVPRGYANPNALPPKGSRRYQTVRGPGDGRRVDAVVPHLASRLVTANARGGAAPAPTASQPMEGTAPVDLPTIDVRVATDAMVLLLFVSVLLQPLIYAHANGFTIHAALLPESSARPSYVRAAQAMVVAAVGVGHSAFLVGEYVGGARLTVAPLDFRPPRAAVCRDRAKRISLLAAGGTFAWFTLSALGGTPLGDAAARATLACDAFVKPGHQLADFAPDGWLNRLTFRCGAAPATSVLPRPQLDHITSPPAWRAIARSMRDSDLLIRALNAASEDALLAGWVDRIKPLDPSDVPERFLNALPGYDDVGLETLPFSPVYAPLQTKWSPLPPSQLPIPGSAPACVRSPFEMMLPATQVLVTAWLRHALNDLVRVRQAVAAGRAPHLVDGTERRDRPRAIAVGREELHEWARDRVWDCRAACCRNLDFQAPIKTHLDLSYLRRRLQDYPDQHLVSNILEGARLDADVELQSVFVPHLVSLPLGYASVGKEVRRLRALGWYDFFPDFPFWPLYLNGQGATARKLEPDRFRRTTEGGGPRQPTFDLAGLLAISINAASFIPHIPAHFRRDKRPAMKEWLTARGLLPEPTVIDPGRSKWPKETKPQLSQLIRDLAILKRAAWLLGEPLYVFGDDFKDYFNQLAMAECELHKLGIVFLQDGNDPEMASGSAHVPTAEAGQLVFISELRLGFGTHGASNIAQRFSDALLHLFREDMDAVEAPIFDQADSKLTQWMEERRQAAAAAVKRESAPAGVEPESTTKPSANDRQERLWRRVWLQQRRLYSCYVYSDDPVFITVGVDRTLRALRVWRQLTQSANLIMAIPEKRHLGTHATWLGILVLCCLGLIVVPKAKLLRASGVIATVLKGGQPFHIYRSLIGLLEHFRAVNLRGRNVMHGLYAPHGAEGAARFGPNGRVFCDELMAKQLLRWQALLRHSAGVSARSAFHRSEVEPHSTFTAFACSDACFGDEDPSGMGGYCHGLFWQFVIPDSDLSVVNTPLLEFLAVVFNIFCFIEFAVPLCGETGTFLLRTDALTTALVLPNESQRSLALIDAFQLLIDSDEWRRFSPRLKIQHIYGDANALSDPLSRSRWREFRLRCRQLNVRPMRVAIPPEAMRLYNRVVHLQRARLAAARSPIIPIRAGGDASDTRRGVSRRITSAPDRFRASPDEHVPNLALLQRWNASLMLPIYVYPVEGKGVGVMARRNLPVGTVVAAYGYRIVKSSTCLPGDYRVEIAGMHGVVGKIDSHTFGPPSLEGVAQVGALLNEPSKGKAPNCVRTAGLNDPRPRAHRRGHFELVTSCAVLAGDELTWDYGRKYRRDYEHGSTEVAATLLSLHHGPPAPASADPPSEPVSPPSPEFDEETDEEAEVEVVDVEVGTSEPAAPQPQPPQPPPQPQPPSQSQTMEVDAGEPLLAYRRSMEDDLRFIWDTVHQNVAFAYATDGTPQAVYPVALIDESSPIHFAGERLLKALKSEAPVGQWVSSWGVSLRQRSSRTFFIAVFARYVFPQVLKEDQTAARAFFPERPTSDSSARTFKRRKAPLKRHLERLQAETQLALVLPSDPPPPSPPLSPAPYSCPRCGVIFWANVDKCLCPASPDPDDATEQTYAVLSVGGNSGNTPPDVQRFSDRLLTVRDDLLFWLYALPRSEHASALLNRTGSNAFSRWATRSAAWFATRMHAAERAEYFRSPGPDFDGDCPQCSSTTAEVWSSTELACCACGQVRPRQPSSTPDVVPLVGPGERRMHWPNASPPPPLSPSDDSLRTGALARFAGTARGVEASLIPKTPANQPNGPILLQFRNAKRVARALAATTFATLPRQTTARAMGNHSAAASASTVVWQWDDPCVVATLFLTVLVVLAAAMVGCNIRLHLYIRGLDRPLLAHNGGLNYGAEPSAGPTQPPPPELPASPPAPPAIFLQCRGGANFLLDLGAMPPAVAPSSRPPPIDWNRVTGPPVEAVAPQAQAPFLLNLRPRQPGAPPAATMPSPANRPIAGLAFPGSPPIGEVLRRRLQTSNLAAVAGRYARARALALTAGPDPTQNLRADINDVYRMGDALNEFAEFGANVNTLKKDDRAWDFWELVCDSLGTSPMRTADDVHANPERQAFLLAALMMYASAVCVPKTPGRSCIKPRSALAYPLAIIRIFARWGIVMPGFKSLQNQLAGLSRAYIMYHGPKSLAPRRAEPMRFSMVRDMNNIKPDGSRTIQGRAWTDDAHPVFMFRRLNLIMIRGGWRLAEWVYHASGEIMYICRCDLWWRINGRIVMDPTDAELRGLRPGDCAFLAPPRSKPDQMGEIHCPFPVTMPFNDSPDNAAAALRDIELRCPCHGAARQTRPVIADELGNPYTHAVLDGILYAVLCFLYGPAMASLFSWHSYRSGLCTALFAANCPDTTNQLICRWMCPESLHVYRRMGTAAHADWIDRASRAPVDAIQSVNVPRVDNDEGYAELFREFQSGNSPRQFMHDWAAAAAPASPAAAAPVAADIGTPRRAAARPTAPHMAPATPTGPTGPVPALTRANAVGRRVLVPSALYPQYVCSEHAGAGWEGQLLSATSVTAVVRFLYARSADGRPYADERLPLDRLTPLA